MDVKKIILILGEEQSKLLKQLEESKCPILTEVIVHGVNRIKAIHYVLPLLRTGQKDFSKERLDLILQLKSFSPLTMPVDIVQIVHRLQILFYINEMLKEEEEK